jgi:pterin-4a-carbinolamine dehydratase
VKDNVLTKRQKEALKSKLPLWQLRKQGTVLRRDVPIESYIDGLVHIARITVHANVLDHYPEITIKPGFLSISLSSQGRHDLTNRDIALAQAIDRLLA